MSLRSVSRKIESELCLSIQGDGFQLPRTDRVVNSRSGRNTRASAACDTVRPTAEKVKPEDHNDSRTRCLEDGASEMRCRWSSQVKILRIVESQ